MKAKVSLLHLEDSDMKFMTIPILNLDFAQIRP